MNRDEITDLLEMVITAYPQTKIKDPAKMVEVWEMTFGEYDAETIYKATRLHMSKSKFFPTPADIKEKITKAEILFTEAPTNRIAASTSSYIEEMLEPEAILEYLFVDKPTEDCFNCKNYNKCYGNMELSYLQN